MILESPGQMPLDREQDVNQHGLVGKHDGDRAIFTKALNKALVDG